MIALLLAACSSPISNAPFYEDETFLAALPDQARLGVPPAVRDASIGDEPLTDAAVAQAAYLDALVGPLAQLGATVAAAEPSERHDTYRVWEAVPASVGTADDRYDVWVHVEITRPSPELPIDWTLQVGPTRIGPWVPVAWGSHGTAGGELTWDVDAAGELLGMADLDGTYGVTYGREDEPRNVQISLHRDIAGPSLLPQTWGLFGADAIGWVGWFEVTDDAQSWPGWVVARQVETGGRAEGFVLLDDAETAFARCWDAHGDVVWWGGDSGVTDTGSADGCAVGPFVE